MMDTTDDMRMNYAMIPPPSMLSRLTPMTVEVTVWGKEKDGSWNIKGQTIQTILFARDHWNYHIEIGWRRIA